MPKRRAKKDAEQALKIRAVARQQNTEKQAQYRQYCNTFLDFAAYDSPCRIRTAFWKSAAASISKAGPAAIIIVCSRTKNATRKVLGIFGTLLKMLGVAEIQRTGKGIISDVCIVGSCDAVLILVEDGDELSLCQDCLF